MNLRESLLKPTPMLNFNHESIQTLIKKRKWKALEPYEAIGQIYLFVRDEIKSLRDLFPAPRGEIGK